MTAFDPETSKKAIEIQQSKYKDLSAEMARRANMRKTHGTGGWRYMKEHDPERFKQIIAEREAKRKNASKTIQGGEGES